MTNFEILKENNIEITWENYQEILQVYNKKCEETGQYDKQIYEMDEIDEYFDGLTLSEIFDRLSEDFHIFQDYFMEGDNGIISGDYLDELMDNEILAAAIVDMK